MNKEFKDFLAEKDYVSAADLLSRLEAEEAADIIGRLETTDAVHLCRELESDFLAEILVLLDADLQKDIIENLHEEQLQDVMEEVSTDDTVDIIEDLPSVSAAKIADAEEITQLLSEKKFAVLKPLLASMNEIDLAEIISDLDETLVPVVFRLLPKDLAADTFVELDSDLQALLLSKLNNIELKAVMDELFIDDMVDLIEEMPANVVKRLLLQSDKETRGYINEILKYPKDSAGSIMTIEFVSLFPTMTVEQAFDKIRSTAIDKETIYTCYVIDAKNILIGMVSVKNLLLAPKSALISDIMEDNVIYAHTTDDKEDVARKLSTYGFLAIPIVDDERRLVGIVTVDDAMDVLQEENTEDIAKMAAIKPDSKPYIKSGVFSIWLNRIPWLLVLMVSATFTGLILNSYEVRLSNISPALFACVPMIMDTGGNAGSQASVTVIRALALHELETKDILKVIWKEFRASLLLGATLAVACFAKLMLIDGLLLKAIFPEYPDYPWDKCAVVSFALMITVMLAKFVGSTLPIFAKKCKLDPAVVASPFITTIVDAVSLIIYCAISVAILS